MRPARSAHDVFAAELHSGGTKSRGFRIDVRHCQQNPIPPTRSGLRAVRQWPTTGTLYFARSNLRALFGAQSFDPRGVSLGGVERHFFNGSIRRCNSRQTVERETCRQLQNFPQNRVPSVGRCEILALIQKERFSPHLRRAQL
jgi:hypothetical protein